MRFHVHKFEETSRKFNEPTREVTEARGYLDNSSLMIAVGFTNITSRCSHCGEIKVERFIGRLE